MILSQILFVRPSRCIKASFYIPESRPNFPATRDFRTKISMKLIYQYIHVAISFNLSPTSNHLHPLQVENCESNSRLVVDEDDNGKFRLERVEEAVIPLMVEETAVVSWKKYIYCLTLSIAQMSLFQTVLRHLVIHAKHVISLPEWRCYRYYLTRRTLIMN